MKTWTALSAVALAAVAGFALAGNPNSKNTPAPKNPGSTERSKPIAGGDVIQTLTNAGNFKTLLAAINATELKNILRDAGPYTFFAPTDEAFSALPPGVTETLMKPENRVHLTNILKFHVLQGKVFRQDVKQMKESSLTLSGQSFAVENKDGTIFIGTDPKWMATIVKFDMPASNGVVHSIDRVLMPRE
jgi:uncharacterized surface protein with fasciclin (FAS1) repeats